MENMNTSANSIASSRKGSLVNQVAKNLVIQQLGQLREGVLTIRQSGMDDLVFGDGNTEHRPAELIRVHGGIC